ncbi:MAG: HEAT repeat domain-containing protein [Deltaproteobacteria bacterium]|nr:HEAT repeat domain-containing protein [Deltaproteobacteria bacterium]
MKLGLLLDEWVPLLRSTDAGEVARASEALSSALASNDESLRDRAARLLVRALGQEPALAEAALHLLQVSWFPPTPGLAKPAAQAALGALPRLAAGSPAIQDAALLLANICRVEPGQLADLTAALDHELPAVRQAAAGALGRAGEAAAAQVPALIRSLSDPRAEVVDAALTSLCALAPLAPLAAPALLQVVRAQHGHRRYQALAALRGLLEAARLEGRSFPDGLDDGATAMAEAVADRDAAARLEASVCLGLLGSDQPQAAAALRQLLADTEPEVAAHAAAALLRLQGAPREALDLLEALLHDGEPARQQAALDALEGLEPSLLRQGKLGELLIRVTASAPGDIQQAIRALLQPATADRAASD